MSSNRQCPADKYTCTGKSKAKHSRRISKEKTLSPDHPCAKELTYRLAVIIAIDLQSFSIVEDVGFRQLVAALEPTYSLLSQRYLSEVVIPEIHTKVKHGITELLQSAKYISLTTNIWTSMNCHHSF